MPLKLIEWPTPRMPKPSADPPPDPLSKHLGESLRVIEGRVDKIGDNLGSATLDLAGIKEALGWHWKTGATIAALFVAAFGWFLLHYLPGQLEAARDKVQNDMTHELAPQFSAIENKLTSLQLDLARLAAKIDLQQPRAADKLPGYIKERTTAANQETKIKLRMEEVKALASEAERLGIVAKPEMMTGAADAVFRLASDRQDAAPESWEAVAALINYQAFLFARLYDLSSVANNTKPCVQNPPASVGGKREHIEGDLYRIEPLVLSDCVQVLDNVNWDAVRFQRCLLVYHGGRVGLGILVYDGCLFHVDLTAEPAPSGKELLKLLIKLVVPMLQIGHAIQV